MCGCLKIHQRGVQWKQGVVIYMMLSTSLLYNTTPIHCTHPPVMNTHCQRHGRQRHASSDLPHDLFSLDVFALLFPRACTAPRRGAQGPPIRSPLSMCNDGLSFTYFIRCMLTCFLRGPLLRPTRRALVRTRCRRCRRFPAGSAPSKRVDCFFFCSFSS